MSNRTFVCRDATEHTISAKLSAVFYLPSSLGFLFLLVATIAGVTDTPLGSHSHEEDVRTQSLAVHITSEILMLTEMRPTSDLPELLAPTTDFAFSEHDDCLPLLVRLGLGNLLLSLDAQTRAHSELVTTSTASEWHSYNFCPQEDSDTHTNARYAEPLTGSYSICKL
jgi:hypothetical protein